MNTNIYVPGLRAALRRTLPTPLPPTTLTPAAARPRTPALQSATSTQLSQLRPHSGGRRYARTKQSAPAKSAEPAPESPQIDAPAVMIAEPGKGLKGPFLTSKILRSLNQNTHTLRVVAPGDGQVPICRIFDLRAEEEQRVAREEKAKELEKKKNKYKIVEMGWTIAENDLNMKMGRMRKFLDDGCRVEVVLLRRKGTKEADRGVCEGLVERVREVIGGIEGAKEAKGPEGYMGRQLKMFVEKSEKQS